jgi:hypothetical protein
VIELVRRFALAAGAATFLWLLLDTRPLLYRVSPADFGEEYAKQYGKRSRPLLPGVMGLSERLVRETTDPGSAEAFRDREVQGRLLSSTVDGAPWLKAAEASGRLWLAGDDPGLAPLLPELERVYHQGAGWLNAYLPVKTAGGTRYLEFLRYDEPRKSEAPAALVHPHRALAWPWLGVALLGYLLLPGAAARPGEARRDPLPTGVLDFAAVVFGGFLFSLPFVVLPSTAAALGELAGFTGFCWVLAAATGCLLMYNASRAAFGFSRRPGEVRIRRLWGERIIPLTEICAVEPLTRGEERTGVLLRLRDGSREKIDWTGLLHAETVLSVVQPAE